MEDPLAYKTPRHEPVRPRTTLSPRLLQSRGAMVKTILAEGESLVKKGLFSKAEKLFSSAIKQRGKDIESQNLRIYTYNKERVDGILQRSDCRIRYVKTA
jgi:hypothetical protein